MMIARAYFVQGRVDAIGDIFTGLVDELTIMSDDRDVDDEFLLDALAAAMEAHSALEVRVGELMCEIVRREKPVEGER